VVTTGGSSAFAFGCVKLFGRRRRNVGAKDKAAALAPARRCGNGRGRRETDQAEPTAQVEAGSARQPS